MYIYIYQGSTCIHYFKIWILKQNFIWKSPDRRFRAWARARPMANQNHGLESLRANNEGELYEPRTVLATWRYPMDSESCMRVLLVQSFIFVERVIAYTLLVPSNAMGAHQRPRAPRTGLTYKVRTKLTKRRSGMKYNCHKSKCKTCGRALTCSHHAIKQ